MLVIGLLEKYIRFVDIDSDNNINYIEEIENSFDVNSFFEQAVFNEEVINIIAQNINYAIKNFSIEANLAKFLLETNQFYLNTIPLDYNSEPEQLNSDILWELSNYFPLGYKNFKINYHKLLTESLSDNIYKTLVIAFDKNKIDVIKKLINLINIKIISTDIEHFSSEKYCRKVYKSEITKNDFLILGCKKNRFDISLITEKGCIDYDYFFFDDGNFQEHLLISLNKFIYKTSIVLLYGEDYTVSVYKFIKESFNNVKVILSNPYFDLKINDNVNKDYQSEGFRFASLCGLALN